MFESMFDVFESNPIYAILICLGISVVLSFLVSLAYVIFKKQVGYTKGFPIALVILPPICAMLVSVVNIRAGELASSATGIGLFMAGIFALTRFRSDPLNVEDMMYIILCSAIGISSGLGYVGYTVIGTLLILVLIYVLSFFKFGQTSPLSKRIKILVPEDLNYEEEFQTIMKNYCSVVVLDKIKTVDFGQLFELGYNIVLKKGANQKEMIDLLRAKNGNLQVVMTAR